MSDISVLGNQQDLKYISCADSYCGSPCTCGVIQEC